MAQDEERVGDAVAGQRRKKGDSDKYTDEEKKLIFEYLEDHLTVGQVKAFLKKKDMKVSGTKAALIQRIMGAVKEASVTYAELIDILDAILPWGPQHVFLFDRVTMSVEQARIFANMDTFATYLSGKGSVKTLRSKLPLALPEVLTVSSIEHTGDLIRVTSIERRAGYFRDEKLDKSTNTKRGAKVQLRAFVERVLRGLIIFELDVVQQQAMVQVTRLASGDDYEQALQRFWRLVRKWMDSAWFPRLSIKKAIKKIHLGFLKDSVRAHGVAYDTVAGGRVDARSASATQSLEDDPDVVDSTNKIQKTGTGRLGNFYWVKYPGSETATSDKGIHVKLLGLASRVHFHTSNSEEVVRHVLADVRKASR